MTPCPTTWIPQMLTVWTRPFAEGMIMHHQMAVDMARDILEYTDYEEIRTMAQNIIDVQEKEIAQMEKILNDQQESQPE